jgi:hypothetical protein
MENQILDQLIKEDTENNSTRYLPLAVYNDLSGLPKPAKLSLEGVTDKREIVMIKANLLQK